MKKAPDPAIGAAAVRDVIADFLEDRGHQAAAIEARYLPGPLLARARPRRPKPLPRHRRAAPLAGELSSAPSIKALLEALAVRDAEAIARGAKPLPLEGRVVP